MMLSNLKHQWAPVWTSAITRAQINVGTVATSTSAFRGSTTRLFATTAEDVEKVTAAIAEKGDEIRRLKADKAPKDAITPAVEGLLQLKKEYERLTGKSFDPPKEAPKEKIAVPPPSPKENKKADMKPTEPSEPIVRVSYYDAALGKDSGIGYGDYDIIASQSETGRQFASIDTLGTEQGPAVGETVWIRGRVSSIRAKGNACFMVLRSKSFYTVQACHFKEAEDPEESKKLIKYAGGLTLESIVDIMGEVVAADVKSCSQSNIEIKIKKVYTVSRAPAVLPFLLEDAARPQAEIDASQSTDRPFPSVQQDVRLNNRWLDLRVPANNAIMRVRSGVSLLFREALHNEGFIEINTPKLIAGESEGGSDVFRTDYFGQPACLAQSPQLYKQMAISADLERVYEIGPVFRAENSNTRRHLCEFTGLDLEMSIKEHYNEALGVLHRLFRHIFDGLEVRYAKELEVIRTQYPSDPVRFTGEPLILHWGEGMQMLKDAGNQVDELADLSSSLELTLGELVKAKYNADFYILDQYPSAIRPFYTMPSPTNPLYSNSYDLFIRGQEICSGAQRCHETAMLEDRIREKGMELGPLKYYIESFRHGVSPHAGAGIGLERVVFLYLGLDNVRKSSMFPRDPNRCQP